MDKELSVWQGLLISSIITPICLHLQYPLNLMAMLLAILVFFVYVITDRKKYNIINFVGMYSIIIGSIVGVMMITGKLDEFSLFAQLLASMGMIFLGIILIGVGNHIANPEKVPKNTLYFGTVFFCFILGVYWLLFELLE